MHCQVKTKTEVKRRDCSKESSVHPQMSLSCQLARAALELSESLSQIDFSRYADWVYNPLTYAWPAHQQYLDRYASQECEVVFMGMNPGPWGMAQTGIPFGEINAVVDWLRIDASIGKPDFEHPKRPVQGLACKRSEISGRRLWALFAERFSTPNNFFRRHFVTNYCPLAFMEQSARNVTPDKLPSPVRQQLESICDQHLARLLRLLQPKWLIGVGAWAESCGSRVVGNERLNSIRVGRMLHPSPASPAANKNWASTATRQLQELGVWS